MESVAHSDLYKWQRITSKVKRPARVCITISMTMRTQ